MSGKATKDYNYGFSKSTYKALSAFEITNPIPKRNESEALIVRLDGSGLTKRFKKKQILYIEEFYLAMKSIVSQIISYCSFITFAYSFKDEISLLVSAKEINGDKVYQNRIEKLLPILSGYVSAIFTQSIPLELKMTEKEVFSFDARLLILPKTDLNKYFEARQSFAMSSFVDSLHAFNKLDCKHTYLEVTKTLKENKTKTWDEYPPYLSLGYVGYRNKGNWVTETAKEFYQSWQFYQDVLEEQKP